MPKHNKMPHHIEVNGQLYEQTLMLVHTKHADGVPALMKLVKGDQELDLEGGEEFMVVYAPQSIVSKG